MHAMSGGVIVVTMESSTYMCVLVGWGVMAVKRSAYNACYEWGCCGDNGELYVHACASGGVG